MKEFKAVTEVAAPLAEGWRVMTDFIAYPAWNPLMRAVTGEPRVGARLKLRVARKLGAEETMFLPAKVRVVRPEQEIAWGGGVPGLLDVHHYFRFEATATGHRFVHGEIFSGVLVPLLWPLLRARIRQANYEAVNQAFKARVEAGGVVK